MTTRKCRKFEDTVRRAASRPGPVVVEALPDARIASLARSQLNAGATDLRTEARRSTRSCRRGESDLTSTLTLRAVLDIT